MRVKRKLFSSPQQPQQPQNMASRPQISSRDAQLEEGRLQRQLLITQRMRQKLQADEKKNQMNRIIQLQRMEQRKDLEEDKQRVRVKRMEQNNEVNTSLYKTKARPVNPVPMK